MKKPLLLDGAMGTELIERGLKLPLPLWSADANLFYPEIVTKISSKVSSGDKLFGSVQSGIIAGNQRIIKKIKDSPLFRTYRCSPFTLYELQETTKKYISKSELKIPVWKMISLKYDDLYKRVEEISKVIKSHQ